MSSCSQSLFLPIAHIYSKISFFILKSKWVFFSFFIWDSPECYRILWIKYQRHVKKCSDPAIIRILERYNENIFKTVKIPESEELIIPEPQGMQNLDDNPDDSEIEAKHSKSYNYENGNSRNKNRKPRVAQG